MLLSGQPTSSAASRSAWRPARAGASACGWSPRKPDPEVERRLPRRGRRRPHPRHRDRGRAGQPQPVRVRRASARTWACTTACSASRSPRRRGRHGMRRASASCRRWPCAGCATSAAFRAGEKAERRQDYDRAVLEYSKARQDDPDNVDYRRACERARLRASEEHAFAAGAWLGRGLYKEALDELRLALDLNPGSAAPGRRDASGARPSAAPARAAPIRGRPEGPQAASARCPAWPWAPRRAGAARPLLPQREPARGATRPWAGPRA